MIRIAAIGVAGVSTVAVREPAPNPANQLTGFAMMGYRHAYASMRDGMTLMSTPPNGIDKAKWVDVTPKKLDDSDNAHTLFDVSGHLYLKTDEAVYANGVLDLSRRSVRWFDVGTLPNP